MEIKAGPLIVDDEHVASVQEIISGVLSRPNGRRLAIHKTTRSHVPHTRQHRAGAHLVDVSGLTRILSIDLSSGLVHVQGLVTMRQLVDALLPLGVVPQVRMIF